MELFLFHTNAWAKLLGVATGTYYKLKMIDF